MRLVERIDNFLSKVDWLALSKRWSINYYLLFDCDVCCGEGEDTDGINYWRCEKCDGNGTLTKSQMEDQFISYWKSNPDQRIGQVLINLGLIPDSFIVWNDEESDILEAQGLPPEEYLFWGKNYDKNENLLPKTEWILVKNLDSDHINAIYEYALRHQSRLNPSYRKAFRNVLVQRSVPTDTLDRIETLWNLRA